MMKTQHSEKQNKTKLYVDGSGSCYGSYEHQKNQICAYWSLSLYMYICEVRPSTIWGPGKRPFLSVSEGETILYSPLAKISFFFLARMLLVPKTTVFFLVMGISISYSFLIGRPRQK